MALDDVLMVVRRVCNDRARLHQTEAERWAPEYRGRVLVFKEEVFLLGRLIENALRSGFDA